MYKDKNDNQEKLEAESGLEKSEEVYPDAIIKISRDQYSTFELKRMVETTKDVQIDPDFQRNLVWTSKQKNEFIESILMGIPVPGMYFFENDQGIKQIVDGRQRITTIISFMNNEFTLKNLTILLDFNNKKFNELEPIYRSKIERYQILVYVIEPPTPERVKYDIFDRVNRGGTLLNNQEMRNALYFGKSTKLLQELSATKIFLKATDNAVSPKRMRDKYIILRFLSFYMLRKKIINFEYRSNIEDFLAYSMIQLNLASDDQIQNLKNIFILAMEQSYSVLGQDAFRFMAEEKKRPINMALFESLSYFFASFDSTSFTKKKLKEEISSLKKNLDSSDFFNKNLDSTISVNARFEAFENLQKDLL